MRDKLEKYLKKIDEVIERGPYKDNWDSLAFHKVPDWYRNAKLGILFIGECFLFRLLAMNGIRVGCIKKIQMNTDIILKRMVR